MTSTNEYGSWGVPYNSTTLISYTKDFMVVPDITGWKYIPRSNKMKKEHSSVKLRKLKDIRRKNLEKNFLEIQMKGQKQYVFIKENGKAQVVYQEGRWIAEHIKTAVIKFNYEINKIDKLLIRDFTNEELNEYEKTLQ